MKNPPQDVLDIMNELPKSILDQIDTSMINWSGLELIRFMNEYPNEKVIAKLIQRYNDEYFTRLIEAKKRYKTLKQLLAELE